MGLCLRAESWIWYSCVMVVAIARFVSRTLLFRGDVKRLQVDDWLMFAALCTYTTLVVTINIVATTETNLFPPGYDYRALPSSGISSRVFGSKLVLVVEQCQCATVWAVKACLLIMYYRLTYVLTIALRENFVVKILAAYVALGFGLMEIFYLFVWCRPFRNYWAVPTPNPQCNVATDHLITNAVFNISSDVFLLVLALQMVVRSQLPVNRKLVLGVIFGLGIFVVLAAILNKYYSFTNPYGQAWTFWYTRESSTSLLVANLPYTWTLLRRLFNLRAFDLQISQHTATSMPSPQAPSFSYHSNRTKRARTRGQLQPSLTGTTVADPPPPASLSPTSTSKSLFKTVRSDSHFSPSSPALPFLPPVAELPPSNTFRVPRPEMYRADTAPPACLESGLMDFSGASIRSKIPGSSHARAHCRSDNDLLRPWHAGDSYLYASASSSASNSGDDDLEYDSSGVCALEPLSHHHRHRGHEQHACPCPPIDGLSLGLGADGWGEGDAWHGRLAVQQRQLAREHERMRRRSTRRARSRSRAEGVLALKTRLGLPVELQEVPGVAGNANEGRTTTRKPRAQSLDARGRSRSRSRKNRDHPPLPLPLPPPPPHLGTSASSTQHSRTQTPPAAPETTPNPNADFPSLLLPPPPSPALGISRAPPLAAKVKSSSSNVVAVDDHMPTNSSLAAAPASTSSSTAARARAMADFEAAKRRAANRGCHGGAVDALLELEREILMSEEDVDGQTEAGAVRGGNTVNRTTASASTALPKPTPPAAAAAKFAPAAAPAPRQRQPFASPALVIGARRRSGEEAAKSTTAPPRSLNICSAPKPAPAPADATAGLGLALSLDRHRHSANASPKPPRLGLRPVHSPSPLSDDDTDNDVYHDARSQRVASALSTFSATPADGEEYAHEHAGSEGRQADDEDMDVDELDEADAHIEALDAGETTPLTDDTPSRSRSLELRRPRDGDGGAAVGKTQRRAKGAQPRARRDRDRERDVWRDAVGAGAGAGVERDSKRRGKTRRAVVVARREVA